MQIRSIRYLSLPILITLFSFAKDNSISTNYTSFKYRGNDTSSALSIYLRAEDKYSLFAGDIDLRAGVTALGISKDDDINFFDTIEKNRAIVHSLSIDYYPTADTLISVGRESLDINLLMGSFDGVMVVGDVDNFSAKAFYFNRYSVLYPTYYVNTKLDDLYGVNLYFTKGMFETEATFFTYDDHDVSNIYMSLQSDDFILGIEHLNFSSTSLADEKAYKLRFGYLYESFYAEVGYYDVYEGSLRNIYALGGTEFKIFALHGFLDELDAKNIYADISYKYKNMQAKLHFGHTEYKSDYGTEQIGKEFGVTFATNYDKFGLEATYLTQKSDEIGSISKRTNWFQLQLKYRF